MTRVIIRDMVKDDILATLESEAAKIKYRPCPNWLGNFQFKIYNEKESPSEELMVVAKSILKELEERSKAATPIQEAGKQIFNTIFVQKYESGEFVKPHRDPRSNVGYTVIIPFGEYTGGKHLIEGKEAEVNPGDVLIMPCTIGYSMGPRHSLSEIESGTRYALIFNTIVETNNS